MRRAAGARRPPRSRGARTGKRGAVRDSAGGPLLCGGAIGGGRRGEGAGEGRGSAPFGAGRFSASDPAKKCGSACGEIVGAAILRRLRWRRRWRPGIMRVRLAPCGRAGRLLPCKAALSRRKRGVFSPDSIAWCRRLAEGAARSACRRGSLVLPVGLAPLARFFGCGRRAGCAPVGGGASASASCGVLRLSAQT